MCLGFDAILAGRCGEIGPRGALVASALEPGGPRAQVTGFDVQSYKGAASAAPFSFGRRAFGLSLRPHQRRIKWIGGQIFKPIVGNQNLIFQLDGEISALGRDQSLHT